MHHARDADTEIKQLVEFYNMYDSNRLRLAYCKDNLEELREMWDDIFCDPQAFAYYYFDTVCSEDSDNKILGAYYDDVLVGMVHLNPYNVSIYGKVEREYYIVGVSVREDMRRQGIMRAMLVKVLEDLRQEGCRFTFLMPERQEYYTGFGFEMIYRNKLLEYDLSKCKPDEVDKTSVDAPDIQNLIRYDSGLSAIRCEMLSGYDDRNLSMLARMWNRSLSERYDVFAIRDEKYLRAMCEEHQCQNGDVCVLYSDCADSELVGVYSYDIYEDVMYVERFYNTDGNAGIMIMHALKRAYDTKCQKCIMTVSSVEIASDNYLFDGIEVNIRSGKGIMAKVFENVSNISIKTLNNNSFFDEIV